MQTRLLASSGRGLSRRLALPLLAVSALGLAAFPGRAATLLEYWNFNNDSVVATGTNGATLGSLTSTATAPGTGSGEIYNTSGGNSGKVSSNAAVGAVYSNGLLDMSGVVSSHVNSGSTGTSSWGVWSDSTTNRLGTDATTGGSLIIAGAAASEVDSLVFTLDSAGYSGLALTAAERASSSNAPVLTWSYSTDGTSWSTAAAVTGAGSGSFGTISLSLPTTLNNLSTFYVKEIITFSNGANGSFALDNVQLTGTAVPEPATVALLAGGAVLLLWTQRRRLAC